MKRLVQIATIDTETSVSMKKLLQFFKESGFIVAEVEDYNTRIIVMEEQEGERIIYAENDNEFDLVHYWRT